MMPPHAQPDNPFSPHQLTHTLKQLLTEALTFKPNETNPPRTTYLYNLLIHESPHLPSFQDTLNHINRSLLHNDLFFIKNTGSRGYGLFAKTNLHLFSTLPDNIIAEYQGIVLTHLEAEAIYQTGRGTNYMFEHSSVGTIDASCLETSNLSRYNNQLPSP